MPNAYIVPVLFTAACVVAVTTVVRRLSRRRRARAATEIWDQAFSIISSAAGTPSDPLTVPGPGRERLPRPDRPDATAAVHTRRRT